MDKFQLQVHIGLLNPIYPIEAAQKSILVQHLSNDISLLEASLRINNITVHQSDRTLLNNLLIRIYNNKDK